MPITGIRASTNPGHYIWWFPGSPVKVHVDLRVIEGLHQRLRHPRRGLAEHGLLFGRVFEGAIEILEYQPVAGRTVPEAIAKLPAEPRKRLLIGYYRTEHGEALRLNEDDLFLFKTFFGKPYHLFLLIQPKAFASPNATFFFSRGDRKISEFPFLEFPLDVSLLATEERDLISKRPQTTRQSSGTDAVVRQPGDAGDGSPARLISTPESGKLPTGGATVLKIAAGLLVSAFLLAAVSSTRRK
jgi:hypothetical protein